MKNSSGIGTQFNGEKKIFLLKYNNCIRSVNSKCFEAYLRFDALNINQPIAASNIHCISRQIQTSSNISTSIRNKIRN